MSWIDWMIMIVPLVIVGCIAMYTKRFTRSVADFMAGGRNAGRYLISTARSEMGAGAAVFVAMFEMFYNAGFTFSWWNYLTIPVGLIVSISGFVIYRYRQTRALTLAQFFEMRYSRRFRLFAGIMAFGAGLMNFGIIPALGAKFIVHFIGLPTVVSLGGLVVPTMVLLMIVFLSVALMVTLAGGQVTVLVTDCVEGMFSQFLYVIIAISMLLLFSWSQMTDAVLQQPPGKSLVNPFDSFSNEGFNLWYVLMSMCAMVYGTMAWQNAHAFNSSAATPHESRMGAILGRWREFARLVMITLLALAAVTYLRHPDFAQGAVAVQESLQQIPDESTRSQLLLPMTLSHLLPVGIKGMFCAIVIMGILSGDGIHLHSWGSIFVQDVLLPLRKKPLERAQHLRWLRTAMIGVALFALVFGSLVTLQDYVVMWFQVTTAIYVGGAGSAIIGGLYWSRGTTAGAWCGMVTGSALSLVGILLQQPWVWQPVVSQMQSLWPDSAMLAELPAKFPLKGMTIAFIAILSAVSMYVIVSLLTCRERFNLDKMLHRGAYAVAEDAVATHLKTAWAMRLIGIDHQFSRADRWVTVGIFCWSMALFTTFIVGSTWYLLAPWSDRAWAQFWGVVAVLLPMLIGIATTIWFTIGGVHDLHVFFRRLRTESVEPDDDGTVGGH